MTKTRQTVTVKSSGVTTPLFIIFLVLKLTDIIDWSWVWVLSPLWIPYMLFFIISIVVVLFVAVVTIFT